MLSTVAPSLFRARGSKGQLAQLLSSLGDLCVALLRASCLDALRLELHHKEKLTLWRQVKTAFVQAGRTPDPAHMIGNSNDRVTDTTVSA